MKKHTKTTPIKETVKTNSLTVGDVIKTLSNLPQDAQIRFKGPDHVEGCIDNVAYNNLINDPKVIKVEDDELFDSDVANKLSDEKSVNDIENLAMAPHLYGMDHFGHDIISSIRNTQTDTLLNEPIMMPNTAELNFEKRNLHPEQAQLLDKMRQHNVYMADLMAEVYRRQLAAMFEYQTQCFAHYSITTNRCMCEIIDPNKF